MTVAMQRRIDCLEAMLPKPRPRVVLLIDDYDTDVDADMARHRQAGDDVEFIILRIADPPAQEPRP